jgi:hypothetical protein
MNSSNYIKPLTSSTLNVDIADAYTLATLSDTRKVTFGEDSLTHKKQSTIIRPDTEIISLCDDEATLSDLEPDTEQGDENTAVQSFTVKGMLKPGENDILSGRGAGVNSHPGNVLFRRLIQANKPLYMKADPGQKKRIIKEIVKTATMHGNFLKQNPDTELWEVVSSDEVRKKTGQALRENAPEIKRKHRHTVKMMNTDFTSRAGTDNVPTLMPVQMLGLPTQTAQMTNGMNPTMCSPNSIPTTQAIQNQSEIFKALWNRMNVLSQKQEILKLKQQCLEEEQYELTQSLCELTARSYPSTLSFQPILKPLCEPRAHFFGQTENLRNNAYKQDNSDSLLPKKKRRIIVPGH